MYRNIGVEHKMLGANRPLGDLCGGKSLMHPSATRSIRIASTDIDPDKAMRDVLTQYADFLEERKRKVKETCPDLEPDMRTGWLLWKTSLDEFLYFEEETILPNVDDYRAEWHETQNKGARKPSKNLWVFEKGTDKKKFSITTSAGAKVQPYFDVPPLSDPNVYLFKVQGEELDTGEIRIWVTASTARELQRLVGDLTAENLALAIESVATDPTRDTATQDQESEAAEPLTVTAEHTNCLPPHSQIVAMSAKLDS